MDKSIQNLSDVVLGRDDWRFVVRVIRLWEVPLFSTIEMVLIDENGVKIHATIRKQLVYLFKHKLIEGKVYKLSNFTVLLNSGAYRTTTHTYKLMFQMNTKVEESHDHESSLIPNYGLTLTNISQITSRTQDYEYLVDVIGLITGISAEREFVRDGKLTKILVIELTDQSGKCECTLFGNYVDELQKLMGKVVDGSPVVVIQFAKVKIFRDKASIQNVIGGTTRIYVNPSFPETLKFKEWLAKSGIESSEHVPIIEHGGRPSVEDDFLRMYPKKTIGQLEGLVEDGIFIVFGTCNGVVNGEDWWYPACKCHRSVTPDSRAYYCKACVKYVFDIVPRFKVKIHVGDGKNDAIFLLFDTDIQYLIGKQCVTLISEAKAKNAGYWPTDFDHLKGKKILFKVEKSNSNNFLFDGIFKVKRVCTDPDVINKFISDGGDYTPTKQ